MSDFPRLDRLDAMQRAPLGTFSALRRPSPVATQYKRQAEMYGQALRTLSRAARRGDAGAAMSAIELRDKANADGFSPGGIQRKEDFTANVFDREQSLMKRNADLGAANEMDRKTSGMVLDRGGVNPNATVGAGRGTPLKNGEEAAPTSSWDSGSKDNPKYGAETPRKMSFAEQEMEARKKSTLSGAFGSAAKNRLTRRGSSLDRAILDLPNSYLA